MLIPALLILVPAVIVLATMRRKVELLWWVVLVGTAMFPAYGTVVVPASKSFHVGISSAALMVTTPMVVVLVALLTVGWRTTIAARKAWAVALTFGAFLVCMGVLVWPRDTVTLSGQVHLFIAMLAFPLGAMLASQSRTKRVQLSIVTAVFLILLAELLIMIAQLGGVQIFPTGVLTQETEGSRPNGTYLHPSVPGKVFVALLLILLPLTHSPHSGVRRLANVAVVVGVIITVISESRTNAFGVLVAVILWALINNKMDIGRKFVSIAAVLVAGVLTIPLWADRIANGEDGSIRSLLWDVGVAQIAMRPFTGVGPNQYIPVVGQYNLLAAQGWPVHNTFALAAAEIGLIGCVLLFFPLLIVVRKSFTLIPKSANGTPVHAVVAVAPALVLIGCTGWGLLSETLPLLFLCLGSAWSSLSTQRPFTLGSAVPASAISVPLDPRHWLRKHYPGVGIK